MTFFKLIWEFPLTAGIALFLFVFYFIGILLIPDDILNRYFLSYPGKFNPLNWFLATLFHGSVGHLISNLLYLVFLGRIVEYKVGQVKWLLFYIMAGVISSFVDSFVRGFLFDEKIPAVGASGAISGLAAVAALLSPFRMKIGKYEIFFPVFLIAWIMLYSDFVRLFADDRVAHWAHLSGFFSVFVTAYLLSSDDRKKIKEGFILNSIFFVLTLILLYLLENR